MSSATSSITPTSLVLDAYAAYLSENVTLYPHETLLDVGCGDGRRLLALAPRVHQAIGLDRAEAFSDAHRYAAHLNADNVRLLDGDPFTCDALSDDTADVVLCVGMLERGGDGVALLRRLIRVLKPGGRLICLTLNKHFRFLATLSSRPPASLVGQEDLERLLTVSGYRRLRVRAWDVLPRQATLTQRLTLELAHQFGKHRRSPTLHGALFAEAYRPAEAPRRSRRRPLKRTVPDAPHRAFSTTLYDRARVL